MTSIAWQPVFRRCAGAFTMIEAVISIAFVGLMLVAAIQVIGAATERRAAVTDRSRGEQLARSLMSEILTRRYAESMEAATSAEVLLREYTDTSGSMSVQVIYPNSRYGQYFKPILPPEATSWKLTRFEVSCEDYLAADETLEIKVHLPDAGNLPAAIVDQLTIPETDLPPGPRAWHAFNFSGHAGLDPNTGICVGFTTPSSLGAMRFDYRVGGVNEPDAALISGANSWQWGFPTRGLLYRAYGIYEIGTALGTDAGESATTRSDFDDVDDYHGWSASPPREADGTAIAGLDGWTRSVDVTWVTPANPTIVSGSESGLKRITITIRHGSRVVAEQVALRSAGLPPLELCCFDDLSRQDLPAHLCTGLGGTPQGSGTCMAMNDCPVPAAPMNLLFVVVDQGSPNAQDIAKRTLMEGWGWTVTYISASATQGDFDAAVAANDVIHITEDINSGTLNTKITDAPIGIVTEEAALYDELGIASDDTSYTDTDVDVTDNTHYITSPFAIGSLTIGSAPLPAKRLNGTIAPGAQTLAEVPGSSRITLSVIEAGGALYTGPAAAGRRVALPWAGSAFDINDVSADGLTLMQRALEWAAGREQP